MQVFVDESERRSYLLCALVVREDAGRLRSTMRGLCRPGQRRIHFSKEGDSRRRTILSALEALGLHVRIYRCGPTPADARSLCLHALLDDLVPAGAQMLIMESRDTMDRLDDEVIRAALRTEGTGRLTYRHATPQEEPLLWVPDAVAWAVGRGGEWRRRAEPLVEKLVDAGP